MLGGLQITLTVHKIKMMKEITEVIGVTNVCNICAFQNEEENIFNDPKMCAICENHQLWRISSETLDEIDKIIEENIDADW